MRPLILAGTWLAALAAMAGGHAGAQIAAGAGAVAVALAVYRDRRGFFLAWAVLGVLALAWLRWQVATVPPSTDSIAWWADGGRYAVSGRIATQPELRGATQRFIVSAGSVTSDAGPTPAVGSIQVRVSASREYRKGDLVRLDGRLDEPPLLEGFDYRAYLARRGVLAIMEYPRVRVDGRTSAPDHERWLDAARARAHDVLWRGLPATQAALAEGILLGRRADIPREVNEDFQRAGVAHLIVISGFNIALLAGLVLSAGSSLLGRRRAALLALTGIAVYSVFVGLTPPVARAALMGAVAVLALVSGRPHGAGTALVFAAAVLTLHDPRILEEVSFQLSFAATAGLLVLASPVTAWGRQLFAEEQRTVAVTWRSFAVMVWDTLAVTLAATLATLPLLLLNFGRLSLISPLANLLLVPLFPAVLVAGALGVIAAALLPSAGELVLAPLGGLLALALSVVRRCAAAPGAAIDVPWFTVLHAIIVYCLLAVAALGRLPGRRRRTAAYIGSPPTPLLARPLPVLAFAPAALLLLAAGSAVNDEGYSSESSRVEVFNLPGAPAALVSLAGGARVLVDSGLTRGGARAALDDVLPAGRGQLAAVIVTHDAPSAAGGLAEVVRRYRVPLVLVPPGAEETHWLDDVPAAGAQVVTLRPRLTVTGARAHLEVEPSRQTGRWSVTVRQGARQIALADASADAGIERDGRATRVYVLTSSGRLHVPLPAGGRAAVTTDGEAVRLHPLRGTKPQLELCTSACRDDRRRD